MFISGTKRAIFRLILLFLLLGTVLLGMFPVTRLYYQTVYPLPYESLVKETAAKYGLDPVTVFSVIHTESGFNPDAHSAADARGLMQVTPIALEWAAYRSEAFRSVTTEALFDPEVNIQVGVHILALLTEQFENEVTALAAYNAGIGQVGKWLNDPRYSDDGKTLNEIPFPETDNYVRRIGDTKTMYQRLYDWS